MALIIYPPAIITPRLLPGVKIADAFVSIRKSTGPQVFSPGRSRYRYYIDIPGQLEYSRENLQCRHYPDIGRALHELVYFMRYDSELFPSYIADFLKKHEDDLEVTLQAMEDAMKNGPLIRRHIDA